MKRLLVVLFVVAGCNGPASVPWGDYSPTVKTRIDVLAAAKDCPGLQAEFDTADASGPATMTRTGHNNADLMSYVDTAMKGASCYQK
jgi:hypothetical protein